jgi:alpha-galactosidase
VPPLNGQWPEPCVYYNQWTQFQTRFDEALLRRQAEIAAELGVEYFEVDAGWYAGCHPTSGAAAGAPAVEPSPGAAGARRAGGGDFSAGVGNWRQVDREVFPSGLPAFAAYVRQKGMQFGLWFEPERVALTSSLATEHPDWVLRIDQTEENRRVLAAAAPLSAPYATHGLADFGNPGLRQWMQDTFTHWIEACDIRWFRWDFNVDPRLYWEVRDGPERRGLSQLRHVQGMYEVLDWLRERYPHVFVDGCASGGRRLDLGWLKRAHSYFSSDHTRHFDVVRNHLSGGSRFLPGNWLETKLVRLARGGDEAGTRYDEADYPDTAFHSRFAGTFGISDDLEEWTPAHRLQARRHIAVYKALRRCLGGDFYPLFALPASLDAWDGWQFHDAERDEGFVAAFRLRATTVEQRLRLRGLNPDQRYVLIDPYDNAAKMTDFGHAWMETGIPVSLPIDGSVVYTYRPG